MVWIELITQFTVKTKLYILFVGTATNSLQGNFILHNGQLLLINDEMAQSMGGYAPNGMYHDLFEF